MLGLDFVTHTLDLQRRRYLGVPVIEKIPHCQRRMVTRQAKPVAVVLVSRQDRLEVPVGADLEIVDEIVGGRRDAVHGLQADVSGSPPVAEESIGLPCMQACVYI